MNAITKMKKEPRMVIAIINFLAFFLPWVAISATSSGSMFGEVFSSDAQLSVTGFQLMEYSMLGIILYIIPVILFVIPFVKGTKEISRYLYLALPVIAIAVMFAVSIIAASGGGEYSSGGISVKMSVHRLAGFWIAGACNVIIIILTGIHDFHIKSTDDLKRNMKNVDIEKISNQFSGAAKDIGNNLQKTTFIKCPKCGNKVPKGRQTCPKCGKRIGK